MKNLHTKRNLTFTITPQKLVAIHTTQKFRDLAAVGTMLNAITFAHENGVPYELAKFGRSENPISETIFITGGLLYRALTLSETLMERYKLQPMVMEFENMLNTFRHFKPPELLLEIQSNGPFRIGTKASSSRLLRDLGLNGKNELFKPLETGQRGVAVATIAESDKVWTDLKRGTIPEVHTDVESVIDSLVDEFTLAAEEFIFGMSRELGLSTTIPPSIDGMQLAA